MQTGIDEKLDEAMIRNKLKVAQKEEGYFKLFDIVDMYGKSPACWACDKGYECKKHGLARRDDHLKGDKEFFGQDKKQQKEKS